MDFSSRSRAVHRDLRAMAEPRRTRPRRKHASARGPVVGIFPDGGLGMTMDADEDGGGRLEACIGSAAARGAKEPGKS
jgi:hypothetical protein